MNYKLGKHAPKFHPKTLRFSRFVLPDAEPPPPDKLWREYKVPAKEWGMYFNDICGDCTCAAVAHILMLMTAHTGKMFVPDPEDVMKMYIAISGYDRATGANDNGCAIADVMNYWQTVGLAGHKILGWAQMDHTDILQRHRGMYLFGANNIGVQLPAKAIDQFKAGQAWDVVGDDGGNVGGHDIVEFGYGRLGSDMASWGKGQQKATNAWNHKYTDEGYVVITQDWLKNADGLAPNQLNLDALTKALAATRA